MKRGQKNYISKSVEIFIKFIVCNLILLLCFVWMIVTTQQATTANTYSLEATIVDSYIRNIPSRADKVYFKTSEGDFWITWNTGDKYINSFVDEISDEPSVCLIVLNNSYDFIITGHEMKEVVDIRSDTRIYYSATDYNKSQKDNRIAGICSFVLFFLIFNTYFSVIFFVNRDMIKRFLKYIKTKIDKLHSTKY